MRYFFKWMKDTVGHGTAGCLFFMKTKFIKRKGQEIVEKKKIILSPEDIKEEEETLLESTEEEMEETKVITRSENGTPIVVLRVVTDQKPLVSPRRLSNTRVFRTHCPNRRLAIRILIGEGPSKKKKRTE